VLMRKYACCYANGRPGARAFRANVGKATSAEEFHAIVERYFPREEAGSEERGAGSREQGAGSREQGAGS
jgi:tRNA-dihydrouridine synthase B